MFNEANAVEDLVLDVLDPERPKVKAGALGQPPTRYLSGAGWTYLPATALNRKESDVLVESEVRDALIRLNPEIGARLEYADQVLYRLRAILLSGSGGNLVSANEEFAAWLTGERTMPFGPNGEHVPIRLIDFETLANNRFVATNQYSYKTNVGVRFDITLLVNGIPLVIGEAKTPVRPAISWVDGAVDIHDNYEINAPQMFVPNVFSFATEGKEYRFGSIRMPLESWAPWRNEDATKGGLTEVQAACKVMLSPAVLLDILKNFTATASHRGRKIKLICRFQQYYATNQIVDRVVAGRIKKGLIWHFQGSGKSLLMVFAAQKLRAHTELKNPTVLIVVDRIDLDTQITATFNAADVANTVTANSRAELQTMLAQDTRKVIITTIHKFAEAPGVLNDRDNIIVMVDEAHRTQEGDLGRKMREALPNAFLFGLTGTPINRADHNTFWAFGAAEDENGYMDRYSFQESIRDKATLPLHFEARLVQHRVDQAAIDEAYANVAGDLNEDDLANLGKRAARLGVLLKSPEHVNRVAEDIAEHFQEKIQPNGFKAQVAVFDREACVLFKDALDRVLPPECSEVVFSASTGDPKEWQRFNRSKDDEEKLLDRFRDPADPLQILIVTSRLLTGFDAPILQAIYLDKPMRDHNLLQAITRTNRPFPNKDHGLIVDYLGVFDDVAQSLAFDEKSIRQVVTNIEDVKKHFPKAVNTCLDYFPGVDRTVGGYEGLIAAQEKLPDDKTRDAFAAAYGVVGRLWEAISPDPILGPSETDYRWLTQVYQSVQPPSGHGKLLWHALGAKTLELIHQNIHVDAIRDDLETLVMDADVLEELGALNQPKKAKKVEIKIAARLRKHAGNPKFMALGERLEELRKRHEQGLINSIEFLKMLLELAKDVVKAEQEADPVEEQDRGKAALTELFEEVRNENTPVIAERIVADIDDIVRLVRFDGWQQTIAGEREVKRALRGVLLKYKLHRELELFDRAYGYIRQYY
jgi:type I restriction enzyme, R subunit